jgi:hypothetical protein
LSFVTPAPALAGTQPTIAVCRQDLRPVLPSPP